MVGKSLRYFNRGAEAVCKRERVQVEDDVRDRDGATTAQPCKSGRGLCFIINKLGNNEKVLIRRVI